jgi:hypothetical protein
MDTENFVSTRQALHAVAELLLAGPAYARDADIRLRATSGGFGVWRQPGPRVDGTDLVIGDRRIPLVGTIASVAEAAGLAPRTLADVYADVVSTPVDAPLQVSADGAAELATAFDHGDKALLAFAPDAEAVLWPEHFDIGISVAVEEVNYGVSPGDSFIATPYAYVGPWKVTPGAFWTESFGAARPLSELTDVAAIIAFFRAGQAAARDANPSGQRGETLPQ